MDVRDEIVREFTGPDGVVDDMMAGLHEVRARLLARRQAPGMAAPPAGKPPTSADRRSGR
jgi:hypothetical protein